MEDACVRREENKKDRSLIRLCFVAISCIAVVTVFACAMLYYYFAPKKTEAKVVTVPDLVGACEDSMSIPQGIEVEREYVYSDDVEAGAVISQSPAPKSRRKQTDGQSVRVKLTVSLGKKSGTVPDLVGLPYVAAAIRLREIGADVIAVSIYDTDEKSGTVISTEPPKDTVIRDGDRVVIYVARRRVCASIQVPSFLGMDKESAITEIMLKGLSLGEIGYMISDGALDGKVVMQSLSPDVYVRGGTSIDITLGYDPCGKNEDEYINFD